VRPLKDLRGRRPVGRDTFEDSLEALTAVCQRTAQATRVSKCCTLSTTTLHFLHLVLFLTTESERCLRASDSNQSKCSIIRYNPANVPSTHRSYGPFFPQGHHIHNNSQNDPITTKRMFIVTPYSEVYRKQPRTNPQITKKNQTPPPAAPAQHPTGESRYRMRLA